MRNAARLLCFCLLTVVSHLGSIAATSAAESVGTVTKIENQAQIGTRNAAVGSPVFMNDRLRTGADARLQVTFRDNSVLTLGEKANVVVDRYVFDPGKSRGEILLKATQGAFRFAGGKLKQMENKKITVTTPVAALAVRGTEFWAGPIDGQYGVLLLTGKVDVSNRAGAVRLASPGMGTDIPLVQRGGRKAQRQNPKASKSNG